jgi:hypothetical protein
MIISGAAMDSEDAIQKQFAIANENMRLHYSSESHVYMASNAKLDKQQAQRLLSLILFPICAVGMVTSAIFAMYLDSWYLVGLGFLFWLAMVWHILRVVRINSEWLDHGRSRAEAETS